MKKSWILKNQIGILKFIWIITGFGTDWSPPNQQELERALIFGGLRVSKGKKIERGKLLTS